MGIKRKERKINMDRLKVLGTWIILVIAFYLFSNGIIYLVIHNGSLKNNNENIANNMTITENNKN